VTKGEPMLTTCTLYLIQIIPVIVAGAVGPGV
jgi:hypothetical protein